MPDSIPQLVDFISVILIDWRPEAQRSNLSMITVAELRGELSCVLKKIFSFQAFSHLFMHF